MRTLRQAWLDRCLKTEICAEQINELLTPILIMKTTWSRHGWHAVRKKTWARPAPCPDRHGLPGSDPFPDLTLELNPCIQPWFRAKS